MAETSGEIALPREPVAPFIYFEGAPFMGHINGVFRLTLVAGRGMLKSGDLDDNPVVVAHLRGNAQALLSLRAAIDGALLLASPGDQKSH